MATMKRLGAATGMAAPENTFINFSKIDSTGARFHGQRLTMRKCCFGTRAQWRRIACARDSAHFYQAAVPLASKLLRRGQSPEQVAHDLALLVRHNGFDFAVAPVVHDLAVRGVQ